VNVSEKKGKKKKRKKRKERAGKNTGTRPWLVSTNRRGRRLTNWGGGGGERKKGQKERAPSIEGNAMSSKVTNPRCVWCKATASFFYVSDCSSILLLPAALHGIRRYPRQASKPEAKRSTRAHKHTHTKGQSYSVWHTNTQQSVLIPIHTHPQNSPSSIIPSRYYPSNHVHAPISWPQINCCFYWAMPLGQGLCMNHLGLQHLNLLKLTLTKYD
jgi:hypothetical protein